MVKYIWSKLLKKIRGAAIKNSVIDQTAKVEAGSNIKDVRMDKYSFCGYDCEITCCVIGKFCSIADKVIIGGAFHPIHWVSTSPVFYSGRDSIKKKFCDFEKEGVKRTEIGHDVWIGNYALIKQGVRIGTGSVIGMGSVVTKDVPPYEIWGGNPARCIRKRFSDDVIKALLELEWWDLEEGILGEISEYIKEPERFIEECRKIKNSLGDEQN